MNWRTLMKSSQNPNENFKEFPKPLTKSTKHAEQGLENIDQGGFVNIVTEYDGSKDSKTVVPLPFHVGDRVRYFIPVIEQVPHRYNWEAQIGIVQMVDPRWQTATIFPEDEAEPWRVVPWVYVRKAETS